MSAETPHSGAKPPASLLAGLFFLSAALLTLEMLESRIFAFVLWHHLGFMVISMAMLGMAAAGSVIAARSNYFLAHSRGAFLAGGLGFAASLIIGHLLLAALPLNLNRSLIPTMAVLYLLAFLPFACAGLGLALPFRLYPEHSAKLYLFSMLGSAAGALAVLRGLSMLGAERLLVAVAMVGALAGFFFAWSKSWSRRIIGLGAAVAVLLAVLFHFAPELLRFQAFGSKLMARYLRENPTSRIEVTGWTPYCRIDVVDMGAERLVFGRPYHVKIVFQDGDEPTSILLPDPKTDLAFLAERSPYSAGYLVKPHPDKLLILGPGGGLEVHIALYHRVKDITAVEINPFTTHLVQGPYAQATDRVYDQPGVRLVNAEGRSFLSRTQEKYDLITLNGVDTYTSLASGAYVLSESYLYTQEAMAEYLDHLTDNGAVAFYRIQLIPPRETLRLAAVMVQALRQRGAAHPEDHLVVMEQKYCFNLVVKKKPFTPEEVEELRQRVDSYDYHFPFDDPIGRNRYDEFIRRIVYAPGFAGADAYSRYLTAVREGQEAEFLSRYPFELTGITDDSPYFFKYPLLDMFFLKPPLKLGPILILAQILQSGVLAVFLILWPLRRLPKAAGGWRNSGRALIYFGGVGLGYLLIEIALMQKLVLFLGNPTYSLSVTLTVLLLSSGLGALWIERHPHRRPGRVAALGVAALILILLAVIPPVTRVWLSLELPARVALAAALIFPLGALMGIPFPAGLRAISRRYPDLVPWAWGANSAASVMAAILCVPLAMNTNFTTVLGIAAALYLAVAWAAQDSASS